jgi:nucleoid-associated protein YgaU
MKITKLHLLLIIVAVIMVYVFVDSTRREQTRQKELITKLETQLREQQNQLDELRRRAALEAEQKKIFVADAVAVAGEYWLYTKKENKDVTIGQEILRRAKEELKSENLDKALESVKQAMEAFRAAKPLPCRKKAVYYKVYPGDTLWGIAKMPGHYGRGEMWPKIWRLNKNKISDPDLIYPRQVFLIKKAK